MVASTESDSTAIPYSFEYAATLVNLVAFFLMTVYGLFYVSPAVGEVRVLSWKERVRWCIKVNVYIAAISLAFNVLAMATRFDEQASSLFGYYLHICRPLEWLFTCPLMMLEMAILGGPKLQANRPFQLVSVTVVLLLLGFGATVSQDIFLKFALFACGSSGFVVLARLMDRVVEEHTEGDTRLFSSTSKSGKSTPLKALLIKVLLTWIGFPIWWALSPDGFNVVEDHQIHSGVFLLLNIVAKTVFIWYVYTLDYEMPSDKGAAKLPDEHPDLKQEQSFDAAKDQDQEQKPAAKEDVEDGRRALSTAAPSEQKGSEASERLRERERYLEDRMKEVQDRERQHHEDRERHMDRMLYMENGQRKRMMHQQTRTAPPSGAFAACCQNSEDDDTTYAPIIPSQALHLSNPADGTAHDFVQANNLARVV
jgi:bacteriorhodopsin